MPCARASARSSSWLAPVEDQAPQRVGHRHDLVEAGAALVAGLRAAHARAGLVRGDAARARRSRSRRASSLVSFTGDLALAQAPHEPLGDHALHARGHEEGLDPHLDQPRGGERRVVGVQRREHEVPGQRRLDRDLSGLDVADLADHDHVGVGPDHGAQAGGEGQAGLRVHLHLLDALELVLDRVLDGDDRPVRRVERGQARVEGGGLARAGGPGHEDRAVGRADRGLEARRGRRRPCPSPSRSMTIWRESRMRITTASPRTTGQRRHAQVHVVAVHRQPDAAVLRHALLGDVELGHDLDPRDEAGDQMARNRRRVEHHAVDAEAHAHVVPRAARSGCPRRRGARRRRSPRGRASRRAPRRPTRAAR